VPRRLEDLYRREEEVTIPDPGHEDIVVWMVKPDPVAQDSILRSANAAQAGILAAQFHEDDEEWLALRAAAMETDYDAILNVMTDEYRAKRAPIVAHRVSLSEDWNTDDYLEGLQTAWPELEKRPVDDTERKRVRGELDRFEAECKVQLDAEVEYFRQDLAMKPSEEVFNEETKRRLKFRALLQWNKAYNDFTILASIKDPENHDQPYFSSIESVRRLDGRIKSQLIARYQELVVEVTEGKDSPAQPGSSTSSAPVEPEEINDSSGLVGATA
jgi:hypothetical protein